MKTKGPNFHFIKNLSKNGKYETKRIGKVISLYMTS